MSQGLFGVQNIFLGTIWPQEPLAFSPGQILSGTVLQASSDNAVIFINGLNVVAELETKVLAGEQLLLQVASRRTDGKVVLKKFVSETETKTAAFPAKFTNAELDAVLEYFTQTPGKVSRAVVRSLLDFRLPVSAENVGTLTGLVSRLGFSGQYTPAVVWLWSNGLPVTREAVRATAHLMAQRPSSMDNGSLFSVGSNPEQLEEIKLPETVQKAVTNVFFKPEESPETIAVKLLGLAKNLGLEHEKDLLRFISTHPKNNVEEGIVEKGPRESLKAELLRLLQAPEGDLGPETRVSAGRVLAESTCLQLLNLTGNRSHDVNLFLQGWLVLSENSSSPFFLKIKDERNAAGGRETRNYQIHLFMKTDSLGEIVCGLVLDGSQLDCRFTVSDREAKEFLDQRTDFLAQRLEVLPFQFVIHPSRIAAPTFIDRLWFDEFFVPGTAGILDAKV